MPRIRPSPRIQPHCFEVLCSLRKPLVQMISQGLDPRAPRFGFEQIERLKGHAAAERIAEKGAGVKRFAGRFGPRGVHDFRRADARGERKAAGKRFAEADDVGLEHSSGRKAKRRPVRWKPV